jgi:hypothetical protein
MNSEVESGGRGPEFSHLELEFLDLPVLDLPKTAINNAQNSYQQ